MTAEGIATGIAALGMIGVVVKYVVQSEITKGLSNHTEQLHSWINGSFMRTKEVEARLDAQDARIDELAGK